MKRKRAGLKIIGVGKTKLSLQVYEGCCVKEQIQKGMHGSCLEGAYSYIERFEE